MPAFLKLIRFGNLLFIVLTQYLIRYFLFIPAGAGISLSDFSYFLLVFATICIAAAGYVINDVYDVEADKINKPEKRVIGKKISEKTANNLFIILNVTGVSMGFYLANLIGHPGFSAIFIFTSALLYLYASYLKQIIVVGNILISLLVALVILLPGLFDLLPAITAENRGIQSLLFSLLLDYAFFAFLINLLREMVKDQEDIRGDYNTGIRSLPIVLGVERTSKAIFALALIPLMAIIYYLYMYLFENTVAVLYTLLFILGPLLYFLVQITSAEKKKDFSRLSFILKIILFFGLISIGLHQLLLP
ncbi:MAG: geranylgeranylglycerol-phosphate geranylgeranyltransferase [Salegentibacter sp.]